MTRLYIKRYSSNPLENTGDSSYFNNSKNDSISIFPKKNGKKENIELFDLKSPTQAPEDYHSA